MEPKTLGGVEKGCLEKLENGRAAEGRACRFIAVSAVLWGSIGIFYRKLSALGFTPMEIVQIRMTVAAVAAVFYFMTVDRKKLEISFKDVPWFAGAGIGSLVFFNWCYFRAMEESSLAMAAVLLYTAPIFVFFLSVLFLKERMTLKKGAAILVVFSGSVMASGLVGHRGGGHLSWPGILYGLGAGFGYGLYSIFGKVLLKRYEPETVSIYTFIFAAAGAALFAPLGKGAQLQKTPSAWFFALGIGVVCSMLPFLLYTKGLKQVSASKASVLASLEPVMASVVGFTVFGETLDERKILGIAVILGGILLLEKSKSQTV